MLRIYKGPEAFSFGLEDRFSRKMEISLNQCGIPCLVKDIWSNFWSRNLFFAKVPYGYRLFRQVVAPFNCWIHLSEIKPNDVVWASGPSSPIFDTACWFERNVIEKGAAYVFWIEDDWFSDPLLKPSAEARMKLADLTVAVTPSLRDRIKELYPDKGVIMLEEPIDVERLTPVKVGEETKEPIVLWNGRPWALKKLPMLNGILERVYRKIPFTLRIVTGNKRPEISLTIPWEWKPYDRIREAEYAAGAIAGLAPLEDTLFNRCKGNYKVKTYMALGVPPLASSIGYNHHLIRHGENGFLVKSEEDWEAALIALLNDRPLARKLGAAARQETIIRYSYEALMPVWAEALRRAFREKLVPSY
jgi:glycosyltransferase involved in cell wall biosynthesis